MKGFIIKEFYHIFRDVRTMIILFGMPVVQILLFGFAITNEIKDARIAVLDMSRDEMSRKIVDRMVSSGYFILDSYLQGYDEIEEKFRGGKVKMVVVFQNDFEKNLKRQDLSSIQLIGDASDPNTASLLINYTLGILSTEERDLINHGTARGIIDVEYTMLFNSGLKGVFMFVPGIITILLMLICAMMTSISIAREKELGTMEILLVSPLKPIQIIAGKVTPYVILSFLNAVTIVTLGYFVFGVPVKGSIVFLMIETLLFIVLALSLGILISTVSKNQQVALMISLAGLMLPTILLSGFIFPVENLPVALQWLSHLMPPKWFIIVIKNVMLKGVGIVYVWKETAILVFMTLVFIALSVRNFKIRLE
jgi:ABC-2 type transport system permease protein